MHATFVQLYLFEQIWCEYLFKTRRFTTGSYKIRGAYNKISSLSKEELENGIVCASAGNHVQGVALACSKMKIYGTIFMSTPTPKQKVEQVKMFGGSYVDIQLTGDTFDDAYNAAKYISDSLSKTFVHPAAILTFTGCNVH